MAFFDFAPADSFHYAATVIHFPCNGPSCSTSPTPGPYYTSTIGPRHNYLPFRFTSFCNSNGTGFPNDMANRSGSSSDTDHTTHTSTRITLPTSSSSTSTSGYHDINSSPLVMCYLDLGGFWIG